MPRKGFTSEQIIRLLKEAEILIGEGSTTKEAVRRIGVSEQTFYKWRREYGGLRVDRAKGLSPTKRRRTMVHVCAFLEISQHRACGVLAQFRSTQRHRGQLLDEEALLIKRMVELACR